MVVETRSTMTYNPSFAKRRGPVSVSGSWLCNSFASSHVLCGKAMEGVIAKAESRSMRH